jgi:UDP-glucose 4-epimerase
MTMNRSKEDRTMRLPATIGVTGAAGFIGANLCERLLQEGCTVIGVDDMSMGTLRNLTGVMDHPSFRFRQLDCRDAGRMHAAMHDCDAIAHMAALKIPRYGGALKTLAVNVDGSHVALDLGRQTGAHVVLASTSDVYGQAEPPFREDDPIVLGPPTTRRWSYAASKYYDEHLALCMAEEEGLKVTILRFFNAYGVRNHPSWWGGPLSVFFEDLLDGRMMEIHGDGRQTRSFTYVSDTVDGVVRALARVGGDGVLGEVINIGNDQPIEIVDLARKVQDAMGIAGPLRAKFIGLETIGGNYQDVRHRVPDLSKAKRLLGFEPRVSLEEGLARTLAWHLELREDAVEAVEVA